MHIDMMEQRHLWITTNITKGDAREIIIDREKDVRICDGEHVVKIRFEDKKIKDVLVDDIFVYPHRPTHNHKKGERGNFKVKVS